MKPLWRVQEEAVRYGLEHPSTMLNMEMGTGKTRVAIEIIKRTLPDSVLVVAPKSVVPVWKREIEKYSDGNSFDVLELGTGTINSRAKRIKEFMAESSERIRIIVINYDVVWRDTIYSQLIRHEWGIMILDESHRAKSHSSKTSKACYRLGRSADRRICLSGTPMSNSPLDVFGQYRFLDASIFGTGWTRFTDEFAVRGGPERRFIVGHRNLDVLGAKFHSIAYSCTKEDIREEAGLVDIEGILYRVGYLPPETRRIYQDLRRDFVAEYRSGLITAGNVLVRLLRFQQLTSGFVEMTDTEGKNPTIRELSNVKGVMLKEVVEDISNEEPVVVFYRFRKDVENIRGLFRPDIRPVFELSGDRNELEAWQDCPNGILAVQYQAGSVGVDLTHANYVVFYSLTFSLAEYQQAQSRVHRVGQKKPVTLIHLVIDDTVDEQILNALESKQNVIDQILANGLI